VGALPTNFPGPDRFRVVFAGNMGKAQALGAVLHGAALLQQRGSKVSFVFVGGGVDVDTLKAQAAKLALDNVVFIPPVPMSEVGTLLNEADALLVHLRRDPLFQITIPSKTQAYMAVGKPLLMAVDGDAADLVRQSGGGIVATSEDAESIANAAQSLAMLAPEELTAMGHRAQEYYREQLALRVGVSRFGAIFSKLAVSRSR
jgi:glycosyltransferase involved in cell wall biosynthesis